MVSAWRTGVSRLHSLRLTRPPERTRLTILRDTRDLAADRASAPSVSRDSRRSSTYRTYRHSSRSSRASCERSSRRQWHATATAAGRQKRSTLLAGHGLHMRGLVQKNTHRLGDAARVVAHYIGWPLRFNDRLRVPSLDADQWQSGFGQPLIKPLRHWTDF